MRLKSTLWTILFGGFFLVLLIPATRDIFMGFSSQHPYIGGFIKFFILATFGEIIGLKIVSGKFKLPEGILYRASVWGLLGIASTLAFTLFSGGVAFAQSVDYLPGLNNLLLTAFLTSLVMNATFGAVLMITHRITDTYIDLMLEKKENLNMKLVLETIKWPEFFSFVIFKTLPFFWLPAHTAVFIVPSEFRVLFAASLSVALGVILGFAKRK